MQHFRNYILLFLMIPLMALAEDGSQLWLRYPVNPKSRNIVNSNRKSPTIEIAKKELNQHWSGQAVDLKIDKFPENFKDGYRIVSNPKKISILAKTDLGLLYGSYHLLNLQQQKTNFSNLKLEEKPSYDIRILNHWDNLDGTMSVVMPVIHFGNGKIYQVKFPRDTKNMQEPMRPSGSMQRFLTM